MRGSACGRAILRDLETKPPPANPWNVVNALKVDFAAATAGGATPDVLADLRRQIDTATKGAEATLPPPTQQ